MARRRDRMTRAVQRYERSTGERVPTRYTGNGNDRREASMRNKGRRGVRARARIERQVRAQSTPTAQQLRDREIEATTGYTRDRYGKYRPPRDEARARQEANRRANIERRARINTRQPSGGTVTNS